MKSYDIPDAPWVRDPTAYDGSEGIDGRAHREDEEDYDYDEYED